MSRYYAVLLWYVNKPLKYDPLAIIFHCSLYQWQDYWTVARVITSFCSPDHWYSISHSRNIPAMTGYLLTFSELVIVA